AARQHVHGFHSYPARMHPVTAARVIARLPPPGSQVLDPFCGSRTVLVEARLAGCRALGIDASPLAVELAWLKVRGTRREQRAAIEQSGGEVAAFADAGRKSKAGASQRYLREDVALFEPHVLLELDGLRLGMKSIRDREIRRALALVLSAILVKV